MQRVRPTREQEEDAELTLHATQHTAGTGVDSLDAGGTMAGMSEPQPLAWAVFEADGTCVCVCSDQKHAQTAIQELAYDGMVCEPLYRAITDAERKAIEYGIAECEMTAALCSERPVINAALKALSALRGLLNRTECP
jgi:hypothetical protein